MLCCLSFHQLHGLQQPTDEAVAHDLCDSFLCFDLIKHITCLLFASTPHFFLLHLIKDNAMYSSRHGCQFCLCPEQRHFISLYQILHIPLLVHTHLCRFCRHLECVKSNMKQSDI